VKQDCKPLNRIILCYTFQNAVFELLELASPQALVPSLVGCPLLLIRNTSTYPSLLDLLPNPRTHYTSAVQRSYVLGHDSLMPMKVRAPPHYYNYYYYYYYLILFLLLLNTTSSPILLLLIIIIRRIKNNNNKNNNSNKIIRNLILTKSFVNIIIFTYNLT
jgi:hypothetical protein